MIYWIKRYSSLVILTYISQAILVSNRFEYLKERNKMRNNNDRKHYTNINYIK